MPFRGGDFESNLKELFQARVKAAKAAAAEAEPSDYDKLEESTPSCWTLR
ncbi:hypothetical protein ACWEO2_43755 [Nocardia sp. NPDC004278]